MISSSSVVFIITLIFVGFMSNSATFFGKFYNSAIFYYIFFINLINLICEVLHSSCVTEYALFCQVQVKKVFQKQVPTLSYKALALFCLA